MTISFWKLSLHIPMRMNPHQGPLVFYDHFFLKAFLSYSHVNEPSPRTTCLLWPFLSESFPFIFPCEWTLTMDHLSFMTISFWKLSLHIPMWMNPHHGPPEGFPFMFPCEWAHQKGPPVFINISFWRLSFHIPMWMNPSKRTTHLSWPFLLEGFSFVFPGEWAFTKDCLSFMTISFRGLSLHIPMWMNPHQPQGPPVFLNHFCLIFRVFFEEDVHCMWLSLVGVASSQVLLSQFWRPEARYFL